MAKAETKQVGIRLPGHIQKWLNEKIKNGDYSNMSQAIVSELQKAKNFEEFNADFTLTLKGPQYQKLLDDIKKELESESKN